MWRLRNAPIKIVKKAENHNFCFMIIHDRKSESVIKLSEHTMIYTENFKAHT